jgi:hypothetical protein
MTSSEDVLRRLLEALAEQADRMAGYLDRLYEEAFVGTAGGARVGLLVDDVPWVRVSDFDHSGPEDRHYAVAVGEDGRASVRFGDGERGQRPPAGGKLELRYGRGKGELSVVVTPDGLTVSGQPSGQPSDPAPGKVYGIQRAVVVDGQDPRGLGRLLVRVPRVTGEATVWALPCFGPAAGEAGLPGEGDGCWVLYEGGEVDYPVWLGGAPAKPVNE